MRRPRATVDSAEQKALEQRRDETYLALLHREEDFAFALAKVLLDAQKHGLSKKQYADNLWASFQGWPRSYAKRVESEIRLFVPTQPLPQTELLTAMFGERAVEMKPTDADIPF